MLKNIKNNLNTIIIFLLIIMSLQIIIKFLIDYSFVMSSRNKTKMIEANCEYVVKRKDFDNGKYKYYYDCSNSPYSKQVLPPIFEEANPFVNGLAVVAIKNWLGEKKYTIINKLGNPVIPPYEYDIIFAYNFDGKKAVVCKGQTDAEQYCGVINMNNEYIVSPIYSYWLDMAKLREYIDTK